MNVRQNYVPTSHNYSSAALIGVRSMQVSTSRHEKSKANCGKMRGCAESEVPRLPSSAHVGIRKHGAFNE
eukprot:4079519-Pleurochrysis_carterae.AAC.1